MLEYQRKYGNKSSDEKIPAQQIGKILLYQTRPPNMCGKAMCNVHQLLHRITDTMASWATKEKVTVRHIHSWKSGCQASRDHWIHYSCSENTSRECNGVDLELRRAMVSWLARTMKRGGVLPGFITLAGKESQAPVRWGKMRKQLIKCGKKCLVIKIVTTNDLEDKCHMVEMVGGGLMAVTYRWGRYKRMQGSAWRSRPSSRIGRQIFFSVTKDEKIGGRGFNYDIVRTCKAVVGVIVHQLRLRIKESKKQERGKVECSGRGKM